LQSHNTEFDWIAAKAKLNYSEPNYSESGTAFIRIKHDSLIWMVMRKFGVEGIRLQMTPDSICIVYRLEKQFTTVSWDRISSQYGMPIDYQRMESIILGNIYLPESKDDIDISKDSLGYMFSYMAKDILNNVQIPLFQNTVEKYTIKDARERTIEIQFKDCRKEDDFCYFREYSIPLENDQSVFLRLELSELEINVPKKTTFNIPPHYTRI